MTVTVLISSLVAVRFVGRNECSAYRKIQKHNKKQNKNGRHTSNLRKIMQATLCKSEHRTGFQRQQQRRLFEPEPWSQIPPMNAMIIII